MEVKFNIGLKTENKEIFEYLGNASESTFGLVENLVGKTSKNARSAAKKIEEGTGLQIGGENEYWRNWKSKKPGMHKTDAYWDPKTKAFKTRSRKAKGGVSDYGLENFKFFKRPGKVSLEAVASARLTSNIANLHDADVSFPKGSLSFRSEKRSKWISYGKGDVRPGKNFFKDYRIEAEKAFAKSSEEALSAWKEAIEKGEAK